MSVEQPATEEVEMPLQRGMFGYRPAHVDSALKAAEAERSRLKTDLADAEAERNALRSDLAAARLEVERLRAEVTERDSQATDVRAELVHARQTLEQDRQAIIHEKEMILEAAHQLADEIQRRAQRRITEEGWELHRARIERQRFVESFRGLLLKYMEDVDRVASGIAASGAPTSAVAEIPPEVFSAAADRLFVPPGFEAPEATQRSAHERFTS
jgi:hypothetical protein